MLNAHFHCVKMVNAGLADYVTEGVVQPLKSDEEVQTQPVLCEKTAFVLVCQIHTRGLPSKQNSVRKSNLHKNDRPFSLNSVSVDLVWVVCAYWRLQNS